MRPFARLLVVLAALALCTATAPAQPAAPSAARAARATSVLDDAIARMGGAERLRGIERVRFEMLTQWQRTAFDARPYPDQPSYEAHTDLRDYALDAWRNTRRFLAPTATGATWREVTDVVRDTVAIRRAPGGPGTADAWAPLNVAYVDERRELFALAPERLLLAARAAPDLRALPDTTIAGAAYARVAATVDRFPATVLVRRADGLLAAARLRTAAPNDFGLAPWGAMELELWYSAWRKHAGGVVYPYQWDVARVGRPYKRMTIVAAQFDLPAMPDSFAVSDALRAAHAATAARPMHDLPLDSARRLDGRLATFGAFGAPAGAVRLGRRWVLLEGGQAPLNAERAVAWLARADGGGAVAAALVTMPATGSGGAAWFAGQRIPVHAGPGAAPFVRAALRGHGAPPAAVSPVAAGRWLRVDGDSLWMEPIDLPDAPGALVVYVPSLGWAYTGLAAAPLQMDYLLARARERGWRVTRVGSARVISAPAPVSAAQAGGAP